MSRQRQYAMLGEVSNAAEYAEQLRQDLLRERAPVTTFGLPPARSVPGLGLSFQTDDRIAQLALGLDWIITAGAAHIAPSIVNQLSAIAAQVFDYPALTKHIKSSQAAIGGKLKAGARGKLHTALRVLVQRGMSNKQIFSLFSNADRVSQMAANEGFPIEIAEPEVESWAQSSKERMSYFGTGESAETASSVSVKQIHNTLSSIRSGESRNTGKSG